MDQIVSYYVGYPKRGDGEAVADDEKTPPKDGTETLNEVGVKLREC